MTYIQDCCGRACNRKRLDNSSIEPQLTGGLITYGAFTYKEEVCNLVWRDLQDYVYVKKARYKKYVVCFLFYLFTKPETNTQEVNSHRLARQPALGSTAGHRRAARAHPSPAQTGSRNRGGPGEASGATGLGSSCADFRKPGRRSACDS